MQSRRSSKQNGCSPKSSLSSPSQWVFLVDESVTEEDQNDDIKPVVCPLRHPKTDERALFMFAKGNKVYELIKFKEEFRSWAVDDQIIQDGGMIITTPVDSLFLVLPYFVKAAQTAKFMTLDQIVVDADYPECIRLHSCSGLDELHQITDVKGHDDIQAYRYSKDKTLSWLRLKVEALTDAIIENKMNLTSATSSIFIKSNKSESISRDEYVRYSWGIVSEYLSSDISESLREHLGISAAVPEPDTKSVEEPPAKRMKVEIAPTEDYSQSGMAKKSSKDAKMTQAQKKLKKVDKSGMKSLSSFFSPKAKT
ncbi:ribonuclease H2 subunit B-like [Gigantopelta aegis]|uniref:ribonuclease H2 subunit B-like n=1 Tax=Gigantopelta aegis TaxID=1735272 RepID=UPI001B887FEC|nr:ribonuclease H2 subunit B-like [Gigantopelta aegis]